MEALLFASFDTSLLCTLTGSPLDTMSDPSKLARESRAQLQHLVYTWILTDAGNLLDSGMIRADLSSACKQPGTPVLVLSASSVSLMSGLSQHVPEGQSKAR